MGIVKQKSNSKGSLKNLQTLVNNYQHLLNNEIFNKINKLKSQTISWVSPLQQNNYAEYSDEDFLKILNLNRFTNSLDEFWPKRGPQWDALAITNNGTVLLLEAKANIPEIVTPETKASSISKLLINKSLLDTKKYLKINNNIDWSGTFYQYTNRLAHLYFLREKCKVNSYLINLYFVGDTSVNGPGTIEEWEAAIKVMSLYLGLGNHKLKKYMADIFIDVKTFNTNNTSFRGTNNIAINTKFLRSKKLK